MISSRFGVQGEKEFQGAYRLVEVVHWVVEGKWFAYAILSS